MADKRLIDANVLNESIEDWRKRMDGTMNPLDRTIVNVLSAVMDDINEAETIDAVEVVRCRECKKFWEYTESHKTTVEKADGDCMIRCLVAPDDPQFCAVQKDDYCSMGEKMDVTDNNVGNKDNKED